MAKMVVATMALSARWIGAARQRFFTTTASPPRNGIAPMERAARAARSPATCCDCLAAGRRQVLGDDGRRTAVRRGAAIPALDRGRRTTQREGATATRRRRSGGSAATRLVRKRLGAGHELAKQAADGLDGDQVASND